MRFPFTFLLILLITFQVAFSQSQVSNKPLTLTQIEALIKNVDKVVSADIQDEAISNDVEKRGVEFQITDDVLVNLRRIGAGEKTIKALIKIKNFQINQPKKKLSNNITILVANFGEQEEKNDTVTDLIVSQLKASVIKYSNVEILPLNEHFTAQTDKSNIRQKAQEKNAEIVVWGWFKKSNSKIIINYQFELIKELSNAALINTPKTLIEDIPNFDNFSSQLRLSKEISLLTLVSLGIINIELDNFDEAIKYISDAISQFSSQSKIINLSQLYLLRAKSSLNNTCNFIGDNSLSDVNKAIELGADPNSAKILEILAVANIQKNIDKTLEYAEKYNKTASSDEEKADSLFLLMIAHLAKEDESQAKYFAEKLREHLLPLSENFENLLNLAMASFILEDTVKASVYLDKAKSKIESNSPQFYRIYHYQGLFYSLSNSYDLAIENFKKVVELKPNCVPEYLILASLYEKKEDLDSALTTYNQVLAYTSKTWQIYLLKGKIYEEKGDFERAVANYKKAIEIEPRAIEALKSLASVYTYKEKVEEAIDIFSKLILINKNDEDALKSRAELYFKTNKLDLAVSDYRNLFILLAKDSKEINKLFLKSIFSQLNLKFLDIGNYELGIEFSDFYIQCFPQESSGYESKADFLAKEGELDSAIEAFNKAIRLNGNDTSIYKKRATLWEKKNNIDKAFEDLDQAIRLDKKNEDALEQRAKLFARINKFDLAFDDYKQLIKLKAESKTQLSRINARLLLMDLESVVEKQKNYEQGIEFVSEFIQFFPNETVGYEIRSKLWSIMNKTSNALDDINMALQLDPTDASNYKKRSDIYEKSGNIQAAIESMEKAVELSKDDLRKSIYQSMLNSLRQKNN